MKDNELIINPYFFRKVTEIMVTVDKGLYHFNASYDKDIQFDIHSGNYTFINIPYSHPIGFIISPPSSVTIEGGTIAGTQSRENQTITYRYGTIKMKVTPFVTGGYDCLYHGYMGGYNMLRWTSED
jgi:hypothetical protein